MTTPGDTRISALPEAAHSEAGDYMAIDKAGGTARKLSVASLRAEAAGEAVDAVSQITAAAQSATAQALDAKNAANSAAASANSAAASAGTATERANTAAEAAEGVVLQSMPTMSAGVKGGAKLGSGLVIDSDTLSLGNLTDSGNPADGCAIESLEGEGWAEQVTTTGKNLLNPSNCHNSSTNKGITITKLADGWFGVEGTVTGSSVGLVFFAGSVTQSNSIFSPGGTYAISCEIEGTVLVASKVHVQFFAHDNADGSDVHEANLLESTRTNTLTFGDHISRICLYVQAAAEGTVLNGRIRFQIEAGSTATSYEPYTGAKPSPSPEYPQEIEVCRGRNLLDAANATALHTNSASMSVSGDSITVTKSQSSDSSYVLISLPNVGSGYYSAHANATNAGTISLGYCDSDGSNRVQAIAGPGLGRLSVSGALAIPSGKIACMWLYADRTTAGNMTTVFSDIQIELGSTPSPYVPYGHVGFDIYDSQSQHVSTIPVPLPLKSDGARWAGGLPDGTADALTVDSAGKWEWENACEKVVFDGSESIPSTLPSLSGLVNRYEIYVVEIATWTNLEQNPHYLLCSHFQELSNEDSYNHDAIGVLIRATGSHSVLFSVPVSDYANAIEFKTWLTSNNVTLVYKLATPTKESGYVSLPLIPNGASISCPELDSVNVAWFVDGLRPVMERIANERAYIEYLIAEAVTS